MTKDKDKEKNKEKNNSRAKQAEDTKKKIFKVCMKMAQDDDFSNINVKDICKKAEVSVGCFYHHYTSKNDVLIEAYRLADEKFDRAIKNKDLGLTTKEKIINVFAIKMEFVEKIGVEIITQIYKSQINEPEPFLMSKERVLPNVLLGILEEGQKKGEITDQFDIEVIARDLIRFYRGVLYDWCANRGQYNLKDDITSSLGICLYI